MQVTPRAGWGFTGWAGTPTTVPIADRTEFFVHYEGGSPVGNQTGPGVPRAIHAYHLTRGWIGIGYNFVVTQAGEIYEARGWDIVGAHCVDHNRSGIGVQVHIGGDEHPSPEALAACRWLYDELARKTGRQPAKRGHRDGMSTTCPGDPLYAWVRAGMPTPTTPQEDEDDMVTPETIHQIAQAVWEYGISTSSGDLNAPARVHLADTRGIVGGIDAIVKGLPTAITDALAARTDAGAIADAIVAQLPADLARQVADIIAARLAA